MWVAGDFPAVARRSITSTASRSADTCRALGSPVETKSGNGLPEPLIMDANAESNAAPSAGASAGTRAAPLREGIIGVGMEGCFSSCVRTEGCLSSAQVSCQIVAA